MVATAAAPPAPEPSEQLPLRGRRRTFNALLRTLLLIVAAFAGTEFWRVHEALKLQAAHDARLSSVLLADELRQSSNDLTRLARSYVITGNPVFRRQFDAVREIRDGERARPPDYDPSYWDLALLGGEPAPAGEAKPLLTLMREAGLNADELALLAAAKSGSDGLVGYEVEAMNLVASHPPAYPEARRVAGAMLHDKRFHEAKAEIMRPIVEFTRRIDDRTRATVQRSQERIQRLQQLQLLLGLAFIALLWRLQRELHHILGCGVGRLQSVIQSLGEGEFDTPIELRGARPDSVLAWLRQSQQRLAGLELQHFRALVSSSDDAIISKTTTGIIASWNAGAEQLFGYSAAEAVGRPMMMLIPPERADEEPRILARIAAGERIEHFETVRMRKDGSRVEISVTISPIIDSRGRVVGASKIARDITRAKAAEAEVQRLAFYDPLTSLPNRRLLEERLGQALKAAQRGSRSCALMFIDLDHFKALNDTRGHNAGDRLLQAVGERLRGCVRAQDTVARFGGDEFVLLIEDTPMPPAELARRVEAVGSKVAATLTRPYLLEGLPHECTPSIGVALAPVGDSGTDTSGETLLKQADAALYQAKAAGRNTLRFFDARVQALVDRRAGQEQHLRQALQQQAFELHLQPQLDRAGGVRGAEALLRWRRSDGSLVPPGDFIPQAEDSGLIVPLGGWVLQAACVRLARWRSRPETAGMTLAVNVSARQIKEAGFVQRVRDALETSGADPARLVLELTESSMASDVEDVIAKMNALKALGVRFALDDFGTGYSSLAYLKRMPLDELKIDRSFVRDMLEDGNDAAIAGMIVSLARTLQIEVVAEGVETTGQYAALAALGCHGYQGYLFSPPLAEDVFVEWCVQRSGSRAA